MRDLYSIKPQDILLLLKLIVDPGETQQELSQNLSISQTEVSLGLRRLKNSSLLSLESRVNKAASVEFLVHGLKYIFPPKLGTLAVGIPTSFAKPGFKYVRYNDDEIYVWPHAEGTKRGIVLMPIHPSFPEACTKNDKLYKLASLLEMIRSGRARERNIGASELKKMIMSK